MAIGFIVTVGLITVSIRQYVPERIHEPFKPLEGHEPSVYSVALALYGVLWAYDAWYVSIMKRRECPSRSVLQLLYE